MQVLSVSLPGYHEATGVESGHMTGNTRGGVLLQ
uniref:Uncharacterized protein n=1 Tax=Anguilla anguilla TaxID=7936 RepID=A0A0E9XZT8_ANGAN